MENNVRPMSDMTEEEIKQYILLMFPDAISVTHIAHCCNNSITAIIRWKDEIRNKIRCEDVRYWYDNMIFSRTIDFLIEHHFINYKKL